MKAAPLTPQPEWHHLPRLARECYQGFAVVLWTITLERRVTGWLDESFHLHFRELLLHAAGRQGLFCPAYVLMPDHLHVVWMGMRVGSDHRLAIRFLRKYLAAALARRSATGVEFELQKQSHDSVLREEDRWRGAFERVCFYVLDNPRRKGLVNDPGDWPWLGAMVPGCPWLHPLAEDFWGQFWKIYVREREPTPAGLVGWYRNGGALPSAATRGLSPFASQLGFTVERCTRGASVWARARSGRGRLWEL